MSGVYRADAIMKNMSEISLSKKFNVINLGQKDYQEVWDIQRMIHKKRVDKKIDNTLLLGEHMPVMTMGKSGKARNLLFTPDLLEAKGISYYEIERGGDVTYHGPGQLVGYPIFNVKEGLAGIKPFVNNMEDAVIKTLADFDITGEKREKMIGVWTQGKKICSIGIAVKRWVSFHGFALNVNTNLEHFNLIVPCGLKNVTMTSMQVILGCTVDIEEVKQSIVKSFCSVFQIDSRKICLDEII
ncbi:MAG: lipoyl(octanoyl) transferase LipB [bacterium]